MSTTRTVTRLTARQIRVGTAVVSASCAAVVASTVKAREATEALTPGLVEDLASNPALRALYGTPFDLASPGGFTVWRLGMFLAATTGLWGLLTATRLLRGEEEAGRADLVLTAPISRRRLTDVTMLVVAVAAPIIGAAVALGFIATSQAVSSSALFGAGIALLTLDFIAVGALTSQLLGTRRHASGAAGLALGATFLLRMVADGSSGLGWLRWSTPFGWLEELRPFADERAFPLVLLAALAVGLGGLALGLSRERDLGDGIVRERDNAELRPRLLHSALGFQWRQGLGGLVGWGLALVATGLVIGGITSAFTAYVAENPDVQEFVGRFGFGDLGTVAGFVGSIDVFAAMAIALFVVTATNRVWEDEQERRLELVYPSPVTRPEWLGASMLSTVGAALVVSAGCSVATWVAVQAANGDLGLADAALGLLNTLPAVAVFLGTAVLLLGVKPEVTRVGAGGFVIVALFISVFGPTVKLPVWALDLSPFHHLAPAPAAPVAWEATTVLLVLAGALSLAGFVAYRQRDLRG
jgi:ABC-2 type transport system permease protein